ncbi:MAG: hypothetical protein ABI134_24770, partial [Byssovorax sp.]
MAIASPLRGLCTTSAAVRTHGATEYTVATWAIRFRFFFSPGVSRVSSLLTFFSAARHVASR